MTKFTKASHFWHISSKESELVRHRIFPERITSLVLFLLYLPIHIMAQPQDSIIGRPLKSFDLTAFCSYKSFHPSEYLTDNNWDILCAFVQPGTTARLDSLGIPYNNSQLRLLEVGDLLSSKKNIYSTKMHIFGKNETCEIRSQSKAFADSIFPTLEPEIKRLIDAFCQAGYSKQVYSLVFSYLLDDYIWDDAFLLSHNICEDHGTWSGAYWAMYDSRQHDKIGTNGFGPLKQNWSSALGYWIRDSKMLAFAREVSANGGKPIQNQELINSIAGWGLADKRGNILVPVMHRNSNDTIDSLCRAVTTNLSNAVKSRCVSWTKAHNIASQQVGQVIFYHEVMWDLLDILESKGIVSMPAILKGEKVGKEHFGDICYIVIDSAAQQN